MADDFPLTCDGLRVLLEVQGDIQVVGDAANGKEVLHQARQLQPDVVIMDIGMPELNGIEAAHADA